MSKIKTGKIGHFRKKNSIIHLNLLYINKIEEYLKQIQKYLQIFILLILLNQDFLSKILKLIKQNYPSYNLNLEDPLNTTKKTSFLIKFNFNKLL